MTDKKTGELHQDAWERFERAVDVVAKSPPQHRTKSDQRKRESAKSPKKRRAVKK